jgi:Protein of unknown function (DUF3379)
VDCEEAKVLLGGDPGEVPAELLEHLGSCSNCREFRGLMLTFETKLRSALEVRVATRAPGLSRVGAPERRSVSSPIRAAGESRDARRWRVGVGIAAALLAGFALWVSRPPETLAAEIIRHAQGEPESWVQTQPVSVVAVDSVLSVLEDSGFVVRPVMGLAPVVYARNCDFRGHRVAHLVVLTESGPVTVLVLTHERVRVVERFESDGYRGVLVPVHGGSIALVSHSDIALGRATSEVMRGLEVVSKRVGVVSG